MRPKQRRNEQRIPPTEMKCDECGEIFEQIPFEGYTRVCDECESEDLSG